MSLERTSELPPLYTAESSKVPLWDPMLRRPVSLFTWKMYFLRAMFSMGIYGLSPLSQYLAQHCALGEEARFPGVDKGEVEVRLPGTSSIRGVREIQQVVHDLVHHSITTSLLFPGSHGIRYNVRNSLPPHLLSFPPNPAPDLCTPSHCL